MAHSVVAWLCGGLGVLLLLNGCVSVNVDLDHVLVHQGPEHSKFGFSVAMHVSNSRPMLLVGAPQATSASGRNDMSEGGAVFECATQTEKCKPITFDSQGVRYNSTGRPSENKNNQWFGSTLVSGGENGHVVACALLYQHYYLDKEKYRLPIGNCYLSDSEFNAVKRLSPCEDKTPHHTGSGSCQVGFSAAIHMKSGKVALGAVGRNQWQGAGYTYDWNTGENATTLKKSIHFDETYMGYATAMGEFTGDNQPEVVLGTPRGSGYNGTVEFYQIKGNVLENLHVQLTGSQLGSYFGSSLAVTDLNNDGLEDVVVGAPLYTDFTTRNSFEQGRVQIFYQTQYLEFTEGPSLDGIVPNGRFGFSVAPIGDINRDGFNDIAVGAPYAGKGLVYIFHGGSDGIIEEPAQIIGPEDFRRDMTTFGYSVNGGIDLDKNGYPDLLVGAYASDKALYFRSRPIINVNTEFRMDTDGVRLEDEGCLLEDGTKMPCVNLEMCFSFDDSSKESINMEYSIILDKNVRPHRSFFAGSTERSVNSTITVQRGSNQCVHKKAYIMRNPSDKLSPIDIEASYALVESSGGQSFGDNTAPLTPVLAHKKPLTSQLVIKNNCGHNEICIPDLSLSMSPNVSEFEIGSTHLMAVEVVAENRGEDAYNTKMVFMFHSDLNFVRVDKDNKQDPVTCGAPQRLSSHYQQILCDLDNPLKAASSLTFRILLSLHKQVPSVKSLDFRGILNSTNAEDPSTQTDNEASFSIPVNVKVNLAITGRSEPTDIYYNASSVDLNKAILTDLDIGPPVQQSYHIINKGHIIVEAEIYLIWPSYNEQRDQLLYLLEKPTFRGSRPTLVTCEEFDQQLFNPNKLYISEQRSNSRHRRDNRKFYEEISCGVSSPKCGIFKCNVRNMTAGDGVIITINSRLWLQSVAKMKEENVRIMSKLVVRPRRLQFDYATELPYETLNVNTFAIAEDLIPKPTVPWWVILLAIILGVLLLALLIWILYKVGFFKRRRPTEPIDERSTKNGYHTVSTVSKEDKF